MAQQQGTLSAGQVLEKDNFDSSELHLHPLPTNEELPVNEVISINTLTPPVPSLTILKPEQLVMAESERAREHGVLISDTSSDPTIKAVNEDPLWVSVAVSTQSARIQSHECSLCDKMFGTASALNKHLLSHQQERPHVCPICQRAFKRHDHLNGHMLTHQKRKPFPCLEPGCQKSYCDSYALKRHCASQHRFFLVPPPPVSAQVHSATGTWGDFSPCLGGQGGHNDYHSIFFSPPKPVSKPQHKCSGYAGLAGFASYPGFASTSSLGASGFQESAAPQASSLLVLDSWDQRESKGLCGEAAGEPHASQLLSITPQWVSSPEREVSTVSAVQSPGSRMGGLGPHYWGSGLDFPASEFNALEEMLSLQSTKETLSSGGAPHPETSTTSTMRRPTIIIKQKLRQANPRGRARQQPWPDSFASLKTPVGTPKSANNSTISQPSPARTPNPPGQGGTEVWKKRGEKGEEDMGQWQEAPEVSYSVELSPLVIPVSVPVSERTDVAPGDIDGEPAINPAPLAAKRPQGSTGALKRAHRFELLTTLFIPPPTPLQQSPGSVFEEGVVGGQWCRAAGGYPSQLRSPMYLADHLLNPSFQPLHTPPRPC
ncbi:hypothetical protein AAFF_G00370310 [Aldrovandia affinis]|uniref:C2H2-type domain-containing protein n=1 Tax=Aldrovandia affinis TaxID=143900 RepID=A0AAD7SGJ6_9TELE|nr:hypothetical protein AAFF_G00370310 [Aldrovandia affinis]